MALPIGPIIFALKSVGTNQKSRWLLAIILPIMERMKSPSLRILLTTLVPRMMETAFRSMNPEDRRVVLGRLEALVEEHRGKDRGTEFSVPAS